MGVEQEEERGQVLEEDEEKDEVTNGQEDKESPERHISRGWG